MYPQEHGIITATEVCNPLQEPGDLLMQGLDALQEVVDRLLEEACILPLPNGMEPADSSIQVDSRFERTSPLRDEGDIDQMGADTDPGAMGTAESWFREFRGER
jgi:hypothetical protein